MTRIHTDRPFLRKRILFSFPFPSYHYGEALMRGISTGCRQLQSLLAHGKASLSAKLPVASPATLKITTVRTVIISFDEPPQRNARLVFHLSRESLTASPFPFFFLPLLFFTPSVYTGTCLLVTNLRREINIAVSRDFLFFRIVVSLIVGR